MSNTGAYGNHASETLAAAMASPIAAYRCDNKKGVGHVVYTNMIPGGGFSGYGASQTTFAMECAIDELARLLGIDPFEIRRKNVVRPGDNVESIWKEPSDASFGSYGIDECLDIVERELKKGNGVAKPDGEDWAEGTGVALAMLECGPPTEHRSGAEMKLLPDGTYHLACGSSEMGNGITTAHKQIAASIVGVRASDVDIINADTDRTPYDTGTFASTGTVVAGKAVHITAEAMRDDILDFACPPHRRRSRPVPARQRRGGLRQQADPADRAPCRRRQGQSSLHGQPQGLPVAAHDRLQRAGRAARGASRDRRDPHPAQRACRRHRTSASIRCSAAASSMAPSPWATAGR